MKIEDMEKEGYWLKEIKTIKRDGIRSAAILQRGQYQYFVHSFDGIHYTQPLRTNHMQIVLHGGKA